MNKTIEEVSKEALFRLPKATEYQGETCQIKVYHDDVNYTVVYFKKVYGAQHEHSVNWVCTGTSEETK